MSIELQITGMTCGHCQSAVTRVLEGVGGVEKARVDLAAGRATIQGNPEPKQLIEAVEGEGYSARILEVQ